MSSFIRVTLFSPSSSDMKVALYIGYFCVAVNVVRAQPQLRDVGILGLLSHDIFAWDKDKEINTENGRVDLSTIFDYDGGSRWDEGGNPKNEENAPVYTITMPLVDKYKDILRTPGKSAEDARRETVALFHKAIRESFARLTKLPFPERGLRANVTNVEQAVFRAMHDILPGRAKYKDRGLRSLLMPSFKVTNLFLAKTMLNEKELNQEIKDFDGKYDKEYEKIRIPFAGITVNLTEADRAFIEKFTPFRQVDMLAQLGRVGRGDLRMSDVDFMQHATMLMRKAICPTGNVWMPQDVPCDDELLLV
jgi:hypothetical protein